MNPNFKLLCHLDDLDDPGSRGFEAAQAGTPWDLFVVRRDNAVYAYRNSCPHTGAPMDWMPHRFLDLDDAFVQCSIHGALFRPEDSYCVRGPCAGQSLQSLPVMLDSGMVLLERRVWDEA